MITIPLKRKGSYFEQIDEDGFVCGDGLCVEVLDKMFELPQERDSLIDLKIYKTPKKGTVPATLIDEDAEICGRHEYMLQEFRDRLENEGVKEGRVYYVLFLI